MTEKISGHTELTGLITMPIRHSKSPRIHSKASAKLGLDYAYLAFEVENEELEGAMRDFEALKVRGYNVSMPNKTVIGQYLDRLSPATELYGTVNTVVNDNGVLAGHITDGIGYTHSSKGAGIGPAGKKVTIIGAGEATAAIEIWMALDRVKEISIFNHHDELQERTEQNVKNINEEASCKATLFDPAGAKTFKHKIEDSYLFTDATGVGMKLPEGQMVIPDVSFLYKDLTVIDVVYMSTEAELLRVAEGVDCKTMNGLGMTLYQGAAALELQTGREMPIDYMKEVLDIKF